ncbi:DUF4034 domain-containing protein [Dyella lutea]|uniref:DUF4034 domain-containing protein n=1 Tax=Dyella lutea TaxID=2950441 RepID=A0ABT1FF56_9GAMM|nr:DUF4034 domain-containing protein [Dyella lutea]MCP1375755.1 DUF4034 domain-containing protein [Dyella lutea]
MERNHQLLAAGAVALLGAMAVTAYCWTHRHPPLAEAAARIAADPAKSSTVAKPANAEATTAHVFTQAELQAFLAAATKAESIDDPLKRCLAYPDPPASHWSPAAVQAYCRYRTQPIVTLAQARDLIEHGKAAELDRLLGEALHAQLTQPDARGRLDRTFFADFDDGSLDLRYLLDAWKRASPDSAFALAASGFAYVQMAVAARGVDYASKTPQDAMESMHRLMQQADADLQAARQREPRITPIYIAMLQAGGYDFGPSYATRALHEGLQQDPADFAIHAQYVWLSQPQWFGSLDVMQHAIDEGLQQAAKNPLLLLDKNKAAGFRANIENWRDQPVHVADFPAVLDEAADAGSLSAAGNTAAAHRQFIIAAIYLSESVRFNPDAFSDRSRLARLVSAEGQPRLLMLHARQLVAQRPDDPDALGLRGLASLQQGDVPAGRADLAAALEKSPDNPAVLSLLARVYTYSTHEWDKAWTLSSRLIADYPQLPDGWRMRASIQLHQPRAGLDDTLHYFILHFGNDPRQRSVVREMERMLEAEAKGGDDPLAPFRGPRSVPARPVSHPATR